MVHALEDGARPRNGVNLEVVHAVTWHATTNRLCPSDMGARPGDAVSLRTRAAPEMAWNPEKGMRLEDGVRQKLGRILKQLLQTSINSMHHECSVGQFLQATLVEKILDISFLPVLCTFVLMRYNWTGRFSIHHFDQCLDRISQSD